MLGQQLSVPIYRCIRYDTSVITIHSKYNSYINISIDKLIHGKPKWVRRWQQCCSHVRRHHPFICIDKLNNPEKCFVLNSNKITAHSNGSMEWKKNEKTSMNSQHVVELMAEYSNDERVMSNEWWCDSDCACACVSVPVTVRVFCERQRRLHLCLIDTCYTSFAREYIVQCVLELYTQWYVHKVECRLSNIIYFWFPLFIDITDARALLDTTDWPANHNGFVRIELNRFNTKAKLLFVMFWYLKWRDRRKREKGKDNNLLSAHSNAHSTSYVVLWYRCDYMGINMPKATELRLVCFYR